MCFLSTLLTSLIDGRNNFKEIHIERPGARHITRARTSNEMLAAAADVYSTPHGNVGQAEHYVVFMPGDPAVDDLLTAQYMLDHPRERLHPVFKQDDIGSRIVDGEK